MQFSNFIHFNKSWRKPKNEKLFDVVLLIDGIPAYYSVYKNGHKYSFQPAYENLSYPMLSFSLWNNGLDWLIEAKDNDYPERDIAEQAIEALEQRY